MRSTAPTETSRSSGRSGRPFALAIASAAVALCLSVVSARAGSTDPVLVIGHATTSGGSPARLVDLLGAWGFDDTLQINYPLHIVVSQGSSFVRYPIGGTAVAGSFAGLSDGLSVGEIAALEATGTAAPDASILHLALHEMTLALPATFASGTVNVVLYTTLPGEGTFLSNTAVTLGDGS